TFMNAPLRYNEVFGNGAHNSYMWATPWTLLESYGLRNIELDIHRYTDWGWGCGTRQWSVYHIAGELGVYGSGNCAFTPASQGGPVADLLAWHNAHPGHQVITVNLEMTSINKDFDAFDSGDHSPAQLDALLTEGLPIFKPSDFFAICPSAGGTLAGLATAV